MIEGQNIMEIIGNDRYRSCIMTTFSFDFNFFETNVMRSLSSNGIINISVFTDESMLEQDLGILTGMQKQQSRSYSLIPVRSIGAFHPKIYLFFGEKQALLVVGSGNLTSGGHGKNDEIWSAFHYQEEDFKKAELLSQAWNYLSALTSEIQGFSKEKINWIKEYSPWLEQLPLAAQSSYSKIQDNVEISFITNDATGSIIQKLERLIDIEVSDITLVAPYFDKNGTTIKRVCQLFPKSIVKVLLEENRGILPLELNQDEFPNLHFYHWNDCFTSNLSEENRRLHGKLIIFQGETYSCCLMGSANITDAAMIKGINQEASILIKKKNWNTLKDLGISISKANRRKLKTFKASNSLYHATTGTNNKIKGRLKAVDLIDGVFTIYTSYIKQGIIKLFDSYGEFLVGLELSPQDEDLFKVQLKGDVSKAFYAQIFENEVPISNKQIIQDLYVLSKTHPDPINEKLDLMLNTFDGSHVLADVLRYISIEDYKYEPTLQATTGQKQKTSPKENSKNYKVLKYDDFTEISDEIKLKQNRILTLPVNRIADFLGQILRNERKIETGAEFDDEEMVSMDQSIGEYEEKHKVIKSYNSALGESRQVKNFLKKYRDSLTKKVELFCESLNAEDNEDQITVTDLSIFLIALHLLIHYGGKLESLSDDDEPILMIPLGGENEYSVRDYCYEIIGSFLVLLVNGFKDYQSEFVLNRLKKSRIEALYHVLFLVNNVHWHEFQHIDKELLMLNAINFLLPNEESLDQKEIDKELSERITIAGFTNPNLFENLNDLIKSFSSRYHEFKSNMNKPVDERTTTPTAELKANAIIYFSKLGFCGVHHSKTIENGVIELDLLRPGFLYNEEEGEYLFPESIKFKKNIVF